MVGRLRPRECYFYRVDDLILASLQPAVSNLCFCHGFCSEYYSGRETCCPFFSQTAEVSHPGTGLRGGSVELGYALVSSGSSASGVSDEMSDLQERRRSRPEKELGVVKSARELNSDCQVEVNEDGEPMTPLVGEVLTSVRPSSGVVSDAQYAYYMVRAGMLVTRCCATNRRGLSGWWVYPSPSLRADDPPNTSMPQ